MVHILRIKIRVAILILIGEFLKGQKYKKGKMMHNINVHLACAFKFFIPIEGIKFLVAT